jgi:hypothetical protein
LAPELLRVWKDILVAPQVRHGIGLERKKRPNLARQSKENKDEDSTPDSVPVTSGGRASVDNLYEIYQRLTSIESSISFITAAVDDTKTKIEAISKDVVETKAKFEMLKPFARAISKGVWAIFILLLTFGLSVLGMWLKHHYGW